MTTADAKEQIRHIYKACDDATKGVCWGPRIVTPRCGGWLSRMPDMWLVHLHPLRWLGQRDRGFAALRRATRAAIIMPPLFALADKVIGFAVATATFAIIAGATLLKHTTPALHSPLEQVSSSDQQRLAR